MTRPIIDIIATGSKCPKDVLEKSIAFVERLGFVPRYSDVFFDDHPFYACHDKQRFLNLKDALYRDDSHFIWCLRGGSGTSRLLPKLLELDTPQTPKKIMGFSDVTALHLFLTQKWGWHTLHGPTLHTLALNKTTPQVTQHVMDLIHKNETDINLEVTPLNDRLETSLEAPIVGGNLALIQRSIGTPWQLQAQDKILFFEDINEFPYRVAETLDQLKHAGIFNGVKSILFGDFSSDILQKDDKDLLAFILQDFANTTDIPVFKGLAVGHFDNNHPIQLNKLATILKDGNGFMYQQKIHL